MCLPATFADEYVWTATLVSDPLVLAQLTTTGPSVTFTGLPAAADYTLTVAAKNATGISPPSAPVPVTSAA